jgi:hypothetical protein
VCALFKSLRALKGIKTNNPAYFVFYVPTGSCHEVAKMLIATDGPYDALFRDHLLPAIKSEDANEVLAYLLNCCPSVPPTEIYSRKTDESKDFNAVVSILCNIFLKMDEIESDRNKKTLNLVLDFLKRNRDALLRTWIEEKDTNWSYSDLSLIESCTRLIDYQKHFPDYAFELDVPYASESDSYKMRPLVHSAINHNETMFDLLLKYGAKFDPKEPYIALYYYYLGLGFDEFRKRLISMGAELAAPLPKISYNREVQSILQYATIDGDNRIVEDLLCGGFKLLPDEEIDWLSKPQNSPEYSVAIRQKQTPLYNPTDYLAEFPIFEESLAFYRAMHFLKVKPDGSFEYLTGTCVRHRYRFKYTGSYTLECSVLELHIKHSRDLAEEDDYDNYYDQIPPICTKYTILSTALNYLALIDADYDVNDSAEYQIRKMLTSRTKAI